MTRLRLVGLLCGGLVLLVISYLAGTRSRVLVDAESPYGRVRVVELASGLRQLRTGEQGVLQTSLYPGRPRHLESAYTRVGMIGLALVRPQPRILFIGLGGGAMPTYVRHTLPDADVDVVEIDPLIVDLARQYFGFTPDARLRVHTDDGRAFIERAAPASYDLIVLDAFSADEVPHALTTLEFLTTVRARLAPDGVVISNLWSAAPAYRSMVATYLRVFDDVSLVRVPRRRQRILIAGGPAHVHSEAAIVQAARTLEARAPLGFDLAALVGQGWEGRPAQAAPVLRDREQHVARHRALRRTRGPPVRGSRNSWPAPPADLLRTSSTRYHAETAEHPSGADDAAWMKR